MLREKSRNFRNFFFRNNTIFHNLQLFVPQQYNFSQLAFFISATYTLRFLIDVPPLINFLIFFALSKQTTKAKILCSFCFHSKLFIATFIACNFFGGNESSQHLMPTTFLKMFSRNIWCPQLLQLFLPATISVYKVATCARKSKVLDSSPAASYVQRWALSSNLPTNF